jgi:two-component system, OmpR family, sensor histidine kinase KdpD
MISSERKRRGRLKIFLGYAAGTGKTYRMLEEAQKLRNEGIDVVVGYFEPHARQDTIAKTEGLEIVPRHRLEYRGVVFEEMDTQAILSRKPAVCAVDEFAHTNVPGSERSKRWEDVLVLLDAGIDVLTNMNLQHLESLNDQVHQISGIRVRETVPDWVIQEADEVIMVDLTPEALLNRIRRGVVYDRAKADQALRHFFKESTLRGLRELALRQAAHEVEMRQEEPTPAGRRPPLQSLESGQVEGMQSLDRILVHISADPSTAMLIRRGKRVADYLHAECYAICVNARSSLVGMPSSEREPIEKHLNFARSLRLETRILQGEDTAATLVDFARRQHITQIFMSRRMLDRAGRFRRNLVFQLLRLASDIQVTIIADRSRPDTPKNRKNIKT